MTIVVTKDKGQAKAFESLRAMIDEVYRLKGTGEITGYTVARNAAGEPVMGVRLPIDVNTEEGYARFEELGGHWAYLAA